jgi:hypothetical protein
MSAGVATLAATNALGAKLKPGTTLEVRVSKPAGACRADPENPQVQVKWSLDSSEPVDILVSLSNESGDLYTAELSGVAGRAGDEQTIPAQEGNVEVLVRVTSIDDGDVMTLEQNFLIEEPCREASSRLFVGNLSWGSTD